MANSDEQSCPPHGTRSFGFSELLGLVMSCHVFHATLLALLHRDGAWAFPERASGQPLNCWAFRERVSEFLALTWLHAAPCRSHVGPIFTFSTLHHAWASTENL